MCIVTCHRGVVVGVVRLLCGFCRCNSRRWMRRVDGIGGGLVLLLFLMLLLQLGLSRLLVSLLLLLLLLLRYLYAGVAVGVMGWELLQPRKLLIRHTHVSISATKCTTLRCICGCCCCAAHLMDTAVQGLVWLLLHRRGVPVRGLPAASPTEQRHAESRFTVPS